MATWSLMWALSAGRSRLLDSDFKWTLGDCLPRKDSIGHVPWEWVWRGGASLGAFRAAERVEASGGEVLSMRRLTRLSGLVRSGSFSAYTDGRAYADRLYLWSFPPADLPRAVALLTGARRPTLSAVLGRQGLLQVWQTSTPTLNLLANGGLAARLPAAEAAILARVETARRRIARARSPRSYLVALAALSKPGHPAPRRRRRTAP